MNGSSENLTFSEESKCSIFLPYCEEKQRSWGYNFGLKKKNKKKLTFAPGNTVRWLEGITT